jgi:hypothetical protein
VADMLLQRRTPFFFATGAEETFSSGRSRPGDERHNFNPAGMIGRRFWQVVSIDILFSEASGDGNS